MKTWYCGFIGFLIKNAHLPSYNTMSLMFNAFIASSLCPYNKHNGTANFFDKSFKVKLYSKLLRQSRTISGCHTANFHNPKDITLSIMRADVRVYLTVPTDEYATPD